MKAVLRYTIVILAIATSFAIGTVFGIKLSEERSEQNNMKYASILKEQDAETISETTKEDDVSTEVFQDNRSSIDEAYANGWQYWFAGYGYGDTKSISAQYIGKHIYGKRYGKDFASEYDAFAAGYCDGCFQVNGSSPDVSYYQDRIDKGYNEYYGG